jgi:hypothetical protein
MRQPARRRPDGITGQDNFNIAGIKFVGCVDGAGQGAIADAVESTAQREQRVCENGIVLNIGFIDGEADFEGGELGEHMSVEWRSGELRMGRAEDGG